MKKYSIIIFLPALFILAFINANSPIIQKDSSSSSILTKPNANFNTDLNYPDSEIERPGIYGHGTVHTCQGFQKLAGYAGSDPKAPVIACSFISSHISAGIELFDNDHLSYNYPSHNFW